MESERCGLRCWWLAERGGTNPRQASLVEVPRLLEHEEHRRDEERDGDAGCASWTR